MVCFSNFNKHCRWTKLLPITDLLVDFDLSIVWEYPNLQFYIDQEPLNIKYSIDWYSLVRIISQPCGRWYTCCHWCAINLIDYLWQWLCLNPIIPLSDMPLYQWLAGKYDLNSLKISNFDPITALPGSHLRYMLHSLHSCMLSLAVQPARTNSSEHQNSTTIVDLFD